MQITRIRGDTCPDVFTIINAKTSNPANLQGCAFKLTVNADPTPAGPTQAYQLDGVITDAGAGEVTFTPTETQANLVGYFYYDVQMTDSYGLKSTLVMDTYLYKQDITK